MSLPIPFAMKPPFSLLPLFGRRLTAPALALLAALSACATSGPKGPPACVAGDAGLRSAQAWFYAPERTSLTAAGYAQSFPPGPGISTARRVQQDLDAEAAAIDRLDGGYGGVESCHLNELRNLHSRQASGSLAARAAADAIAEERRKLDEARTGTRVALAHAADLSAIYSAVAEKLAQAQPSVQIAVMRANAEPHPSVGYKVTERAVIYAAPDTHSGTIAPVRRGQRVSGPQAVPKPGWVIIELNDGSIGYVMASVLRPVPLNPSALSRSHGHQPEANNNPIVVALLTARRTLPEKIQALEARLDSGRDEEIRALVPLAAAPVAAAPASATPLAAVQDVPAPTAAR